MFCGKKLGFESHIGSGPAAYDLYISCSYMENVKKKRISRSIDLIWWTVIPFDIYSEV